MAGQTKGDSSAFSDAICTGDSGTPKQPSVLVDEGTLEATAFEGLACSGDQRSGFCQLSANFGAGILPQQPEACNAVIRLMPVKDSDFSGEGGIRTHGSFHFAGFQDRFLHQSWQAIWRISGVFLPSFCQECPFVGLVAQVRIVL